jgi:hypothetical protein
MNYNQAIHQILHNWVCTLSIDEQSGESIVTTEDVNHLHKLLTDLFNEKSRLTHFKKWLSISILKALRINNLFNKSKKSKVSPNLLNRL